MQRLRPGKLAPVVERFVFDIVQEFSNLDDEGVDLYLEAVKTCPVLGSIIDVKNLIALQVLGEYTHPDPDIEDFIRGNFRNIDGSFQWSFAEMFFAEAMGFSFLEIEWGKKDGLWQLFSLRGVDPRYYQFLGSQGRTVGIRYQSQKGQIDIPIEKGIHIVNKRYLTFGDPYGVATLKQAIAAWRAWKILMGQMLVAGQRQATGVIVGYAPSGDQVYKYDENGDIVTDSNGDPVTQPAPFALNEQLQGLENGSVISTDLQNRIELLNQQTDGQFFLQAIDLCERLMMLAFAFPNTLISTGNNSGRSGTAGSGDSNLNSGHRALIEITIKSMVGQISEEILEKIVRPLIFWNFGEQENYGEFKPKEVDSGDKLGLIQSLINAVQTGFFSAADEDVINKGRELMGLPKIEEVIAPTQPPQFSQPPTNYWK